MSRRRRIIHRESTITLAASAAVGALAGFALGALLVQRGGGIAAVLDKVQRAVRDGMDDADSEEPAYHMDGGVHDDDALDGESEDDSGTPAPDDDAAAMEIEERVLTAFLNDPTLSQCAIRISAMGDGVVRLRGDVDSASKREHATILTHGVPGVTRVANRLNVRRRRARS